MKRLVHVLFPSLLAAVLATASVGLGPPRHDDRGLKPQGGKPAPPRSFERHRPWAGMSTEQLREAREHVIAVVGDLRPLSDQDKARLRAMDPDDFHRLLEQSAGRLLALARLRDKQPVLYEFKIQDLLLDRESGQIARHIQEARDAGRTGEVARLQVELRDLVARQIELRFETRAYEIELLERRVEDMKRSLAADQQRQAALISERIAALETEAQETLRERESAATRDADGG